MKKFIDILEKWHNEDMYKEKIGETVSGFDIYEYENWNGKICYFVENAFSCEVIYRNNNIELPFRVGELWFKPRYYKTFGEAVKQCESNMKKYADIIKQEKIRKIQDDSVAMYLKQSVD